MKKFLILIILLSLSTPALANECSQIKNNDMMHLCKGNTIMINGYDLRQFSAGNCDLIRSADWRNVCLKHPGQIKNADLRNLEEGKCILIKDADLRHLCRAWKK